MSNMIEKVARAINPLLWEAYDKAPANEHGLDESIALSLTMARRAIEAMMEPTEDMQIAMSECYDPTWGYPHGSGIEKEWALNSWQAALQEALKND